MSFNDKVVLITGGGSGIGAATAILFAKEGANVAIVGRNETNLKKVAEQIEEIGKKPLYIKADLTNDEETKTIVKKVIDAYGKLNILVNNAGITAYGSILKEDLLEQFDRVVAINLRGAIHLTKLAAPYLIETKGNIVNVSSIFGSSFMRKYTAMAYGISKAGLDHFTRGAAIELARVGVRVNAVSPGATVTDIMTTNGINKTWEDARVAYKLNRVSEPEEIADMIAYLASDKARGIIGVNYAIDNGGLVLS